MLSLLYARGFPHSAQNFPVLTVPQLQVQGPICGLALPHSWQNFPVFSVPHWHFHVSPSVFAFTGSGFGLPQSEQKRPVFFPPHEHVHPSADAGSGFTSGAG